MKYQPSQSERNYWIIDWLSRQGAAEWHGLAESWSWGDGVEAPLQWIVRQDDCDRATAATIFWLCEPEYYLEKGDDFEHPVKDMVVEIIERWRADRYKTSRFDFGGDDMDDHRAGLVERYDIPASLADPIAGGQAFPDLSDLPAEIDIAWSRATGDEVTNAEAPAETSSVSTSDQPYAPSEATQRVQALRRQIGSTESFGTTPGTGLVARVKGLFGR